MSLRLQRQFASPPFRAAVRGGLPHRRGPSHHPDRAGGLLAQRQRVDLVDVPAEPAQVPVVDLPDVALDLPVALAIVAHVGRHVEVLGRLPPVHAPGDEAQGLVVDELHLVDRHLERLAHDLLSLEVRPVDVEEHVGVLRLEPARVLDEGHRVAEGAAPERVDVEDGGDHHEVRHEQPAPGKVEADAVQGIRAVGRDLDGLARDHEVDDLAVLEELRGRLVARHREELLRRESEQVGKGVRARRRMEDTELGDGARHVGSREDVDAGGGPAVAVEVLVAPELRPGVEPRRRTVRVVPVGEEDGRDLDLLADLGLELLPHLGRRARGVARVDDDPAARSLDGEAVRDAPAPQRIHARHDLLRDLLVGNAHPAVDLESQAGRDDPVRPRDRIHGQGRAVPGGLRRCGAGDGERSERQHGHGATHLHGPTVHAVPFALWVCGATRVILMPAKAMATASSGLTKLKMA